jgi:hypothetical protein
LERGSGGCAGFPLKSACSDYPRFPREDGKAELTDLMTIGFPT